ncbi:receptor-type adenylate cyclase, partial [Trypanosoma conorhini]
VFGWPAADSNKFIKRMLTDGRTADAYMLAPIVLQEALLDYWRAAVADGVKFVSGQVIATGTNPLAKDTRHDAIRRFQGAMRDYLKNSGQRVYNDADQFRTHDGDGEFMVDGWIAGEVLARALRDCKGVRDRKSFMASIFNQRRYVIDDLVIGDFGGEFLLLWEACGGMYAFRFSCLGALYVIISCGLQLFVLFSLTLLVLLVFTGSLSAVKVVFFCCSATVCMR